MNKTLLGVMVAMVIAVVQINASAAVPDDEAGARGGGPGADSPAAGRDYSSGDAGQRDHGRRGLDESETRSREGLQRGADQAAPEADEGIERAREGLESDSPRGFEQERQRRPGSR